MRAGEPALKLWRLQVEPTLSKAMRTLRTAGIRDEAQVVLRGKSILIVEDEPLIATWHPLCPERDRGKHHRCNQRTRRIAFDPDSGHFSGRSRCEPRCARLRRRMSGADAPRHSISLLHGLRPRAGTEVLAQCSDSAETCAANQIGRGCERPSRLVSAAPRPRASLQTR
jgi:hypothetical protein